MDVGSVYGSYYETAKSYMGLRKEEKQAGFAEKVTDKKSGFPRRYDFRGIQGVF